ncbi:Lycopene cyclase, beta and epsilon [Plesiocystis pacifica SIR-1]|uniref:Lycopene cyclase, beta and epsilon n=1 Tax=Plesiocystis pacifica SIR-1 TaxID=391625 RepID=A6G822_9BACT|nr:lycopene cyclase family protein [Plesiocystis pacifica]EDM77984.1 Lycopene cyclase, beta and epsilon [Plesiocystis pacifica SIR-1]
MTDLDRDLWVIGAGPAGLALAEACARCGIRLGVVDPTPERPWVPNYGLWLDDAEAIGVREFVGVEWPRARIELGSGGRSLERGYGLMDADGLRAAWVARCSEAGAAFVAGSVEGVEHDAAGVTLALADGSSLRGKVVVDASGHGSRFVASEPGPGPGYQVAWGELWPVSAVPEAMRETMTFMDWRAVPGEEALDDGLPPTFLYVMPVAADRVFVEETVLVGHPEGEPGSWFEPLKTRLHQRMNQAPAGSPLAELRGLRLGEVLEVERCVIPMGVALPVASQRTLAFGGAAAMVHPATGYMFTPTLRRRDGVAQALAAALSQPEAALAEALATGRLHRAMWAAIWPADRVRAWRLYTFGMGILAQMDRPAIDAFFTEFFELDDARWRSFVSASAPTPELMATMLRYFGAAPWGIQRRLGGALLGGSGLRMARGFAGLRRR